MSNENDEITKDTVKELLEKHLQKTLPFALEEFEIVVKPIATADVNSANIQNLVNAVYYIYLQSPADVCTKLYIVIRQFAKAFKETEYVKKLDNLWTGTAEKTEKNILIIPTIETIVIRDMSNPFFIVGKRYNLGYGPTYTLGELNLRIQFVKRRMFDIFCEIYLENDLQEQFTMPAFDTPASQPVMPKL